jgi:transposase InsO family protein
MTLYQNYSARLVYRLFDFPRCRLYRQASPPADEESELRQALIRLAGKWPTYGYRRLTKMLRREGHLINAKRVRRLMRELGILGEPPVRRPRTTDSRHGSPRYSNLVKDLEVVRPDLVRAADITYLRLLRELVYLAVVMDVFTRAVRGWHLSRGLDVGLRMTALDKDLQSRTPEIHHSDQGVQYASMEYVGLLKTSKVATSMAKVGKPRENGFAERLMRNVKEEEVDLSEYLDFADALRQIRRFLEAVYNRKRIHSSMGYLMPEEFEHQWQQKRGA